MQVMTVMWKREVFTLPHVFRAESERSPSCPRTVLGLNSDFFLAGSPPNLENPSPNFVLGQLGL